MTSPRVIWRLILMWILVGIGGYFSPVDGLGMACIAFLATIYAVGA